MGDSPNWPGPNLSATPSVAAIEAARRAANVSITALAAAAGIDPRAYERLLAGQRRPRPSTLARLQAGLRKAVATPRGLVSADLLAGLYRGCVAIVAPHFGVAAAAVLAADPSRGATADTHWRACAHARQAAIYVLNTGFGLPQRQIAELLGVTPAAVCLGLKDVETRRDDPDFDRFLAQAARLATAREEFA